MKLLHNVLFPAAFGALAFVAAPVSAQTDINAEVASCERGQTMGCLNAARHYQEVEDPEQPAKAMQYSKQACDAGSTFGCRLYVLVTFRAAISTHQRVITTLLEGDPKGEWRTKGDLNMGIEQARAYYQEVQRVDPSQDDDWDAKYAQLDELMQ